MEQLPFQGFAALYKPQMWLERWVGIFLIRSEPLWIGCVRLATSGCQAILSRVIDPVCSGFSCVVFRIWTDDDREAAVVLP